MSETVQDRDTVTMECYVCALTNSAISSDLASPIINVGGDSV